jgi:peptide chain release factor 1
LTGIVVTSQTRSRINSLKNCKKTLLEKLTSNHTETVHNSLSNIRKSQVGSGMRGDKIRTIQFQNDSATDHRNGKRCTAQDYMKGGMFKLWT